LHHLSFPVSVGEGAEIRVETGVRQGDAISPFYDPMIAKLVVHAADRVSALSALGRALEGTEVAGSTVNTGFLAALAADPDFAAGDVDTGMIDRKQDALVAIPEPSARIAALAALAASGALDREADDDPWSALAGYAHFHPVEKQVALTYGESELTASIAARPGSRFTVSINGMDQAVSGTDADLPRLARWPGHVTVFDGAVTHVFSAPDPLEAANDDAAGGDSLRAPMPGLVKLVRAEAGQSVARGQPLLVLEAMKMEHAITAPHDGEIAEIVAEGTQVTDGTVLVRFAEVE
jgi:3-methylcrotonyl-CoA carboxylase alpha subunit